MMSVRKLISITLVALATLVLLPGSTFAQATVNPTFMLSGPSGV
jgi:hypothetical protein